MLIDGLECVDHLWIIVMFLSSVWTAPIHYRGPVGEQVGWNATFLQICFDVQANSSTTYMTWGWVNVLQIFLFGELFF